MSGIISIVGGPGTVAMASGGKVYPLYPLTATPTIVAAANTNRRQITFHNPGASVDVYVFPTLMFIGQRLVEFAPTAAIPNGAFLVVANGGTLILSGECQGEWRAITAGPNGVLTVMDSNI